MSTDNTQPSEAKSPAPVKLDIDDAFDDTDDDAEVPYVFSRDAVRKELERSLPAPLDLESEDSQYEHWNSASTTGAFFKTPFSAPVPGASVNHYSNGDAWTSPTVDSPLSSNLSSLSISAAVERHSDTEDDPSQSPQSTGQTKAEDSYPNVIIDASQPPTHRVRLTSESKPRTPTPPPTTSEAWRGSTQEDVTGASRGESTVPAIVVVPLATTVVPSINSAPVSQPVATTSSTPHNHAASSSTIPSSNSAHMLTERPQNHKHSRSHTGPSMFEKVRSRTRPVFLPPKPRKEDDKHLSDWQDMMKQSRVVAEKRRKALQDRRTAREKAIEENLVRWENEILPDWKAVYKNPALRKLWWQGIPTKLRASMWEKAVGNPLALNKDHYRTCLARAKRAFNAGVFPPESLALLEEDVRTTLPALHIFHPETGPMYEDLKEMLYAWIVARADEGLGYTAGAARVAAMLLLNMPCQTAFIVMRNLLDRHCLRSFFGGERSKEDVEAYYRIFDTLLADGMPKIYFNFKQHQISPASYLPDWIVPLFLDHVPFEACARIWDVLLLEGDAFLYRAALGILAVLEPRLFFPDRKELLELLKGENRAALEVAKREGMRLDGGKYEIFGVDEESLWDRIEHMEEWWKESTWSRLIQRELPDAF